jgi:hypothetical protein
LRTLAKRWKAKTETAALLHRRCPDHRCTERGKYHQQIDVDCPLAERSKTGFNANDAPSNIGDHEAEFAQIWPSPARGTSQPAIMKTNVNTVQSHQPTRF